MEKIGICTFYNNNNYGSYLQTFALEAVIGSMGYNAYLIDFNDYTKPWNRQLRNKTIFSRIKCILFHPQLLVEALKAKIVSKQSTKCSTALIRKFKDFLAESLNRYEGNYVKDNFKAFVVGSDQVWKVSLPGLHSVFFLRFCPPAKRISYAASLGGDSIPPYNAKLCYRYLKEFKAISVREDSAVTLLEGLGPDIHPTHVLDPVLLVGKDFWKRYITPHTDPQYLLMYFLDSVSEHEDIILAAIAKYPTHKIRMITTGVQINSIENIEYIEPSPLEFVSLIHNAEFVLTDSFHGSAFSILFDKEFIVLPRNYKVFSGQSARIFSLLAMFECRDRYVTAAAQVSEIRSINRQKTEAILHKMQRTSTSFLAKAINE
ncbi:polysaccharide pyruvyl transferase family protein [uncultured Alistipes sp.]|uniref:polysaccharide pyruvyl transferase family protein n=1 Tax=uncultured Alistipes sp. TaxID=538949 RepID=UPI0028059CB3|nr:polysaccharide pyruvyl transferase family protein [uncultured Alistipes sp.]